MNLDAFREAIMLLPTGLVLTAGLTVVPLLVAFIVSLPLALVRTAKGTLSSSIVLGYTYIFRGTPLMVQLFLIYYGLGQLALVRNSFLWPVFREPLWCALIAFTLNSAAVYSVVDAQKGTLVFEPKTLELPPAGEPKTGSPTAYPSPALAGGFLYLANTGGDCLVVAAKRTYEKVARNKLPAGSSACPVIAEKQLLLRSGKELFCIETP